jgi:hypothetical protein
MKKIILIILCVAIISGGYFYFLNKDRVVIQQDEAIDTVPTQAIKNTKVVRVGDMVVDVPKGLEIQKDSENHYSILIEGQYKEYPETQESVKNHAIRITYGKDWNEESLSLQEWFDLNGPQTQKTSKTSLYDNYKTINNILIVESLYPRISFTDYYDSIENYLLNKKDVYKITFNKQSKETELNFEEQSSIQNYEKIVDQIIQSIRFVE